LLSAIAAVRQNEHTANRPRSTIDPESRPTQVNDRFRGTTDPDHDRPRETTDRGLRPSRVDDRPRSTTDPGRRPTQRVDRPRSRPTQRDDRSGSTTDPGQRPTQVDGTRATFRSRASHHSSSSVLLGASRDVQ